MPVRGLHLGLDDGLQLGLGHGGRVNLQLRLGHGGRVRVSLQLRWGTGGVIPRNVGPAECWEVATRDT